VTGSCGSARLGPRPTADRAQGDLAHPIPGLSKVTASTADTAIRTTPSHQRSASHPLLKAIAKCGEPRGAGQRTGRVGFGQPLGAAGAFILKRS